MPPKIQFTAANDSRLPLGRVHISEVVVFMMGLDFTNMHKRHFDPYGQVNGRVVQNPPDADDSQQIVMGTLLDDEAALVVRGVSDYVRCLERPLPDAVSEGGITHVFPDTVKNETLQRGQELADELSYLILEKLYNAIERQIGTITINDDLSFVAQTLHDLNSENGQVMPEPKRQALFLTASTLFGSYISGLSHHLGSEWVTLNIDPALETEMGVAAHNLLTECGLILHEDGLDQEDLKL